VTYDDTNKNTSNRLVTRSRREERVGDEDRERRGGELGGVAVPALPEHPSGQDPASREGEEAGEDGGGRARTRRD
jgi:hypothetical protein